MASPPKPYERGVGAHSPTHSPSLSSPTTNTFSSATLTNRTTVPVATSSSLAGGRTNLPLTNTQLPLIPNRTWPSTTNTDYSSSYNSYYNNAYSSRSNSPYNSYSSPPYRSSYFNNRLSPYQSRTSNSYLNDRYGSGYGSYSNSNAYPYSSYLNNRYDFGMSRYGSSEDDQYYRNPYPRGKYFNYYDQQQQHQQQGDNPVNSKNRFDYVVENGFVWMRDIHSWVDSFARFSHLLDANFDALYSSFTSFVTLMDHMGYMRREVVYALQAVTLLGLLKKIYNFLFRNDSSYLSPSEGDSDLISYSKFNNTGKKKLWFLRCTLLLLIFLGGPFLIFKIFQYFARKNKIEQDNPTSSNFQPKNNQEWPIVISVQDFVNQESSFRRDEVLHVCGEPSPGWLEVYSLSSHTRGLIPTQYVVPFQPQPQPHTTIAASQQLPPPQQNTTNSPHIHRQNFLPRHQQPQNFSQNSYLSQPPVTTR